MLSDEFLSTDKVDGSIGRESALTRPIRIAVDVSIDGDRRSLPFVDLRKERRNFDLAQLVQLSGELPFKTTEKTA